MNALLSCRSLPLITAFLLAIGTNRGPAADTPSFPAVKDLPVRAAMPDPLVSDDGKKITTPEQWKARREQIKQILEYYALGHRPPPPGNVVGRELQSKKLLDGKVAFRLMHLAFGPEEKLGFDVAIFIPAETDTLKAPFPTIVQPSFFPTPGTTPPRPQGGTAPRQAAGRRSPSRSMTSPSNTPSRSAAAMPSQPSTISRPARTSPTIGRAVSSRRTRIATGVTWRPGRGPCRGA